MNHPSQRTRREQALPALDRFFEQQSRGSSLATQMRYDRVRDRLLEFLAEADMSRCLDLHENARLAAARGRGDGFFGVFGLEEVLVCLGRFVDDDWLLDPVTDARAQVMLAGRLAAWLQQSGLLDRDLLGCAVYETEAAIGAARAELSGSQKAAPATEKPPDERPVLRLIRGGRADP